MRAGLGEMSVAGPLVGVAVWIVLVSAFIAIMSALSKRNPATSEMLADAVNSKLTDTGFVMGEVVAEAACTVRERTRIVLAVLTVPNAYHDFELEMELEYPGDIVQKAIILPDRRVASVPVQKDLRGTYVKYVEPPKVHHPGAF